MPRVDELLSQMQAWPDSKRLRLLLVFEEAHRYLKHRKLEPLLELVARTARAKGVGLVAVSQNAVDLPPAIRNNCATKIQMQTSYSEDLRRAGQTFGSEFQKLVPRLGQGQGAYHYPEYGSALVAFRPPLHQHAAVSEAVLRLHSDTNALRDAVAKLCGHDVADGHDGRPDTSAGHDRPGGAESGALAVNAAATVATRSHVRTSGRFPRHASAAWRPSAKPLLRPGISAPELRDALLASGVAPPSLRTLRRFLKSLARNKDGG